ncbi:hypothetical protein ACFQX7_31465 [Luedemannella flava]
MVALVALGVATVAITRRDAVHRSGWWALLTGCGLGVASGAIYLIPDPPVLAWVTAIAARHALFVVGLLLLFGVRRARPPGQNILDAAIVSVGLAVVGWTFLVGPSIGNRTPTAAYFGVAIVFTVLDLVTLGCVVRILQGGPSRTPTMSLLAAAGGVVLVADLASATRIAAVGLVGFQPGGIIHLSWQVCGLLLAAATLHPTFGVGYPAPAAAGADQSDVGLPRTRMAIFIATGLIAPAMPVIAVWLAGDIGVATALPTLIGSAVLTGVLLVLLVVKLGQVARLADRRAQYLKVQAATLVVQAGVLHQSMAEQEKLQRQMTHRALHDP